VGRARPSVQITCPATPQNVFCQCPFGCRHQMLPWAWFGWRWGCPPDQKAGGVLLELRWAANSQLHPESRTNVKRTPFSHISEIAPVHQALGPVGGGFAHRVFIEQSPSGVFSTPVKTPPPDWNLASVSRQDPGCFQPLLSTVSLLSSPHPGCFQPLLRPPRTGT
jgi:hypothetical protein